MITVKNLIERLQEFNQDSIVTFNIDLDGNGRMYGGLDDIKIIYEHGETVIILNEKDLISILKR